MARLNNEKVMLEQSMEMEEEGIVNRLQRVIETVMARNKVSHTHTPCSEAQASPSKQSSQAAPATSLPNAGASRQCWLAIWCLS